MRQTVSVAASQAPGRAPHSFKWFLASTFASAVGRNAYHIACAWILVISGQGSAGVAAFFAIVSVTEMLASPVAGWMADRYNRRLLCMTADIFRFLSASAFGAILLTSESYWAIWLSGILFATCDRVALTASQCMIPSVGNKFTLPAANSIVFLVMQSGSLCAASLTGFLLFASTPRMTFAAMAVAFGMSVFCMFFVARVPEPDRVVSAPIRPRLRVDASLVYLGAIYALLYIGGMLVSVVGPSFIFAELKGTAIDFGRLESAWSAGSILGVLLLMPLLRVADICSLQVYLLVLTALFFALLKVLDLPWILVVFAILGLLYNLGRVGVEVMVQSAVSTAVLGRAKGTVHFVGVLVGLILFGLMAVGADEIAPSTIFLVFATALAGGAIVLGVCRPKISRVQTRAG